MKKFFKKLLIVLTIIGSLSSVIALAAAPNTYADDTPKRGLDNRKCEYFLGLTSWDCGFNGGIEDEDDLKNGIWIIIANIATDVTVVAAYLVLGYVIYGGYLYIFAAGESGKVATGRKTLAQAFIGLAIVMTANLIMSAFRVVLVGGEFKDCTKTSCVDPGTMVEQIISWFTALAGIASAIFLVYGGIAYITSSGDSGKLQKAKQVITYSLIGLAIVALSVTITAFVSNMIRNAEPTGSINTTKIIKELYEK